MNGQNLRAYLGTFTAQTVFVRDDLGKVDLSEAEIAVRISAYGRDSRLAEYAATGGSDGSVAWTVPPALGNHYGPRLYRYRVLKVEAGENTALAEGILEVV